MSVLQRFRALPVVRHVVRRDALPGDAAALTRDTVTLGWEERLKARARRRSDAGIEFATALPRGTVLRQGDCFALPESIVEVVERDEDVFVVTPSAPAEWGRFAYYIGNSHQPLMITPESLVCPDVPGMRQVLEYHRIPFTMSRRPFTPVGFVPAHGHIAGGSA